VFTVAQIAGVQAAKLTGSLIPLCHTIPLTHVEVTLEMKEEEESEEEPHRVRITARVECEGKTGVEMEALTAATMTALTLYDMCKGLGKTGLGIEEVRLVEKTGGKSGIWRDEEWWEKEGKKEREEENEKSRQT